LGGKIFRFTPLVRRELRPKTGSGSLAERLDSVAEVLLNQGIELNSRTREILMSITLLAMSRTDPANSSRSAVSVFDLEKNRLGIGQFVWLENGCLSGEKAKAEKTADFLRNCTVTALGTSRHASCESLSRR
jgi:hypothetical protein